jgi:hypothetical protein
MQVPEAILNLIARPAPAPIAMGITRRDVEASRRMIEQYRDDIVKCCFCPTDPIVCPHCMISKRIEAFEIKAGISPAEL